MTWSSFGVELRTLNHVRHAAVAFRAGGEKRLRVILGHLGPLIVAINTKEFTFWGLSGGTLL